MKIINVHLNEIFMCFQLASTFGIDFFETSCKTDVNVDAAFQLLSMKIKENQDSKVSTVSQVR